MCSIVLKNNGWWCLRKLNLKNKRCQIYAVNIMHADGLGPLLLTGVIFNPSRDK